MTDNLREKIATAVARELVRQARDCGEYQTRDCYTVADVVIEELGLTIQVAGPDGIAYGKHRYVTDWTAND